ncbi:MAG: hypothetical protein L3J69_12410 [Desulfobacula sp.]|nr:hypothetical protein [Desulfobacula sp.]
MGRKEFRNRFASVAVRNWTVKISKLNDLESKIQALMLEYSDLTGVKILDVQLYDSKTCEIQLEVNI